MKKMMNWVLAAILICGASVMTSCSTNDFPVTPVEPDLNLSETIIGKWMVEELDGQPAVTNEKMTMDIVSTTKAYISASYSHNPAAGTAWFDMLDTDVAIDGNKMILTNQYGENTTVENEFTIADISASEFTAYLKFSMKVGGSVVATKEYPVSYVKVTADYKDAILGMWEGKVTSDEDEHTDGEVHRWEYKDNGTYTYYTKVGDSWSTSSDFKSDYFVDGTLLCTRWQKTADSEELREWWEIESIENGVMKWKALRKKADGTTYTATFEMKKVPVPTEEEIVQKIIGCWISADGYGQPVVTNEKLVLDFVSTTKAYMSGSFNHIQSAGTAWVNKVEHDVAIDGNKITITCHYDQTTTTEEIFTVTAIDDKEFTATLKFTLTVNGNAVFSKEYPVRYAKVNADYNQAIVGKWQGRCTSEGSVFDDGQEHQWEYKADGSYVYYVKEGNQWVASANTLNEYFVAGNLLCTRWVDNGQENREWWEITIENGVMKWTALRKKDDSTTYTATFEMKKVQ